MLEWNRRMSGGEKVGPEYEEMADNLEAGQWPDMGKLKAEQSKEAGETSDESE